MKNIKQKIKNINVKKGVCGFFTDFKTFISKGNIIDLAVAVVIGGAFTKIVNSLVADIIMPLIGLMVGTSDLAEYRWHLHKDVYLNWGNVLLTMIDFLVVAFFIFVVLRIMVNAKRGVKGLRKLTRKERKAIATAVADAQATTPEETEPIQEEPIIIENTDDILRDIRDLLRKQNQTKIEQNKN